MKNPRHLIPRSVGPTTPAIVPSKDSKCPDCRGRKRDRHGFDCVTCAGTGVVDE